MKKNLDEYRKHIKEMSWITKLFVEKRFIGVIYSTFDKEVSRWRAFVQIYNHNGKFIIEKPLLEFKTIYEYNNFYYDKDNGILYGLLENVIGMEGVFKIIKYKIIE